MIPSSKTAPALAAIVGGLMLQGCVATTVVGVAGAAVGTTAKAAGAVAGTTAGAVGDVGKAVTGGRF
jgi:hypothetical protein